MALLVGEVIDELGTANIYAGTPARQLHRHLPNGQDTDKLKLRLVRALHRRVRQHYSFIDRERATCSSGHLYGDQQAPLMSLSTALSPRHPSVFPNIARSPSWRRGSGRRP